MAVWVRIVDGTVAQVGGLPADSVRLDTGEPISDLAGAGARWQRACGWYQLAAIDPAQLDATPEQKEAIRVAVLGARARRARRAEFLEDARTAWAAAKFAGQEHLTDPPTPTPPQPPTGSPTLDQRLLYLYESVFYLYQRVQQLTRWIVGGGSIDTPGIGDALMVLAEAVADLYDQADTVELPEAL